MAADCGCWYCVLRERAPELLEPFRAYLEHEARKMMGEA